MKDNKDNKQHNTKPDILDILLDENNREPIVLVDGKGKAIPFEQVAVIPYNHRIYCILKPLEKIDHIADDEALVFYVDDSEDELGLLIERDEKICLDIFDIYYDMVEEAQNKNKK